MGPTRDKKGLDMGREREKVKVGVESEKCCGKRRNTSQGDRGTVSELPATQSSLTNRLSWPPNEHTSSTMLLTQQLRSCSVIGESHSPVCDRKCTLAEECKAAIKGGGMDSVRTRKHVKEDSMNAEGKGAEDADGSWSWG